MKKMLIALTVVISLLTFSCQKEAMDLNQVKSVPTKELSYEQLEANRIVFAKTFAQALSNIEVRKLIKSEAEKQFDQDTDVLFQLIKDKKLSNQSTLFDYLVSLHGSKAEFEQLTNSLPLLTILVPHLENFSVEKWNIESQVPLVASLSNNKPNGERVLPMPAFNANKEEQTLYSNKIPMVPVLVVKDNERLVIKGSKNARIANNENVAYTSGKFSYIFTDESFDTRKTNSGKNARNGTYTTFDTRVRFAYENNLQFHRDYIYYGIAPELGITTGTLNINYGEYITSIAFNNTTSGTNVFDDKYGTDWPDGNMEFVFNVYFVDGKTTLGSMSKGYSIALADLFEYTVSNNTITLTGTKQFTFPGKGIYIANWDMQRYGDRWKFTCLETDAQTSETFTIQSQISSNFGSNYTNNVKEGTNFGGNSTSGITYTQTYQYVVAGGSDQLYDGLLNWSDKILISSATVPFGFGTRKIGIATNMDTGTIKLSVEPRYIY